MARRAPIRGESEGRTDPQGGARRLKEADHVDLLYEQWRPASDRSLGSVRRKPQIQVFTILLVVSVLLFWGEIVEFYFYPLRTSPHQL